MRLTLARKLWAGFLGILLLAVGSGGLALFFGLRSEAVYKDIITQNLEQASAIYELEVSLLEQGGLTASYLLSDSPQWLDELERRKPFFEDSLARAQHVGLEPDQNAFLAPIREAFEGYERARDQVVRLHSAGRTAEAKSVLLDDMSAQYERAYQLCEALSQANRRDIDQAMSARQEVARRVGWWVTVSLILLAVVILGLARLLRGAVFAPLRRIVEDGSDSKTPDPRDTKRHRSPLNTHRAPRDEVQAVGTCVANLRSDVNEARTRLARTSQRLLDSEKLAMVGRLAAGVAHEIRSPLTSLKLRLFSMQKALRDDPVYQRDVRVMSEEITRLDQIIRNFLEFSRPPELRVQPCDIWLLIDKTLELLKYKLEAGNIRVEREHSAQSGANRGHWPALRADPQQFQQVLLNLINNAMDAQPDGGVVRLSVDLASDIGDVPRAEMMIIRISDSGPGVPADVAGRIFDPFFSTKDAGAGLGLWIARRIVAQHGGMLELEGGQAPFSPDSASDPRRPPDRGEKDSGPLGGAVFAVRMPIITGSNGEQHSGRGRRSERAVGAGATAE